MIPWYWAVLIYFAGVATPIVLAIGAMLLEHGRFGSL